MSRIDLCGFISAAATAGWIQIDFSFCIDFFYIYCFVDFVYFFFCGCVRCRGIWESPFKALSAQPYRCSPCRTHRDSIPTGQSPSREYRHSAGAKRMLKLAGVYIYFGRINLHQHCWHVRQRMHHPNDRTAGWAHRANASRSSCWAQSIWPGSWPVGRT